MRTDFVFKGMMVPVFTPFIDDKRLTINYDVIDKYAHHLKTMGFHGVMVFGSTGEGMALTVEERMKLAERWFEVTRKYDLKMLLNIGGLPLPELYVLAEHAEKLKVDAVMLMPDLFYKPKTAEDLIYYIKDIAMRMPTRPIFYYHIPFMTDVYLDWYKFLHIIEKEVPYFTGFYWADDKIDRVLFLREKFPNYVYIIGAFTSILGYMSEGFDAISMPLMNLFPEMIRELYGYMLDYKMHEAYVVKQKLYKRFYDLFQYDMDIDYLLLIKTEMDKIFPTMKMGPVRRPKITMSKMLKM